MITQIAVYVINSILGIVIGLLVSKIRDTKNIHQEALEEQRKQNDKIREGVMATVSDSYFHMCRRLIDRDYIADDDFENFTRLYNAYKGLGMNGTGTKLYEQISEKKINVG